MNLQSILSQQQLGLDVQEDAIRLAKASRRGRKTRIEQIGSIAVSQAMFNGERIEDWQQLYEVLSELVITTSVRGVATTICLPEALIEFGTISMPPRLSPVAMTQAISAHLGGNKVWQIDYRAQSSATNNELHITYAATERAYLMQYISSLESCGLKVKHVDIDIYALERFTRYQSLHDEEIPYSLRQQLTGIEKNYFAIAAGLAIYGWEDGF